MVDQSKFSSTTEHSQVAMDTNFSIIMDALKVQITDQVGVHDSFVHSSQTIVTDYLTELFQLHFLY